MSAPHYPLEVLRKLKPAWVTPAIDSLAVAEKLKAIRELRFPEAAEQLAACPELEYVLWCIAYFSRQPGGLDKFLCDVLLECPERLRTPAMAKIKWPRNGRYTVAEAIEIWRDFEDDLSAPLSRDGDDYDTRWMSDEELKEARQAERSKRIASQAEEILRIAEKASGQRTSRDRDNLLHELGRLLTGALSVLRKVNPSDSPAAAFLVMTLTPEVFWARCVTQALRLMKDRLVKLATDLDYGFGERGEGADPLKPKTWRGRDGLDGLVPTLLEYMDRYAAKGRRNVPAITVSNQITDKFNYAVEMHANVLIAGDARFLKSVTVGNECRCQPWRVRLVTIPSKPTLRSIVRAHADALGIAYTDKTPPFELEEDVKDVLRHSSLLICYDEFHFAIPPRLPKHGALGCWIGFVATWSIANSASSFAPRGRATTRPSPSS